MNSGSSNARRRLCQLRGRHAVARQQHDALGLGVAHDVEELPPLVREIAPALPAMAIGHDLDGRDDEAQIFAALAKP